LQIIIRHFGSVKKPYSNGDDSTGG
jgi:hypothetical protein